MASSRNLRLHYFLPFSRSNGPGSRAVIWVQGCSFDCPGCFNPETHSFRKGKPISTDQLFEKIVKLDGTVEGITISGGEALQQIRPLLNLLRRVREETNLSVLLFTGYSWKEVEEMKESSELLSYVDILIAGRYDRARKVGRNLLGSADQTLHFLSGRYTEKDLKNTPPSEVIITREGKVIMTGIDPPELFQ
jgi:anaerobic ribonucleoside-triphosphate reductase activating protein